MKSTVSLQVYTDTLLRLISQLKLRGGTQYLSEAITSASNSHRATAYPSTRHHTRRRLDLARAPQIPLPP